MTDPVLKTDYSLGNDMQKSNCYPLVQVHYNSDMLTCNARSLNNEHANNEYNHNDFCNDSGDGDGDGNGSGSDINSRGCGKFKTKLGLGVSPQTGRLQWCPDITCCKFLIILPIVMLPVTLVLILMVRLEGMLIAMQIQSNNYNNLPLKRQQQQFYTDDYDIEALNNDPYQEIVNEQLLIPLNKIKLNDVERIRRCISFKFGLSETIDIEDRDIMRDARTSFLPFDTTAIPLECLETLNYNAGSDVPDYDLYTFMENNGHNRARRDNIIPKALDEKNQSAIFSDYDITDLTTSLKSFWNEQGTKESIRQAQAHTMKKYMDTQVDPCTDFYKYACGNWEKHHPIPKDKAGFDTFEMLRENLDIVLRELLESKTYDGSKNSLNKIDHISDNNYGMHEDAGAGSGADIVRNVKTALDKELAKQKLRRHIVAKRHILSDILLRYRRHTLIFIRPSAAASGANWKRFTNAGTHAPHPRSFFSTSKSTVKNENNSNDKDDANDAILKARHLYKSCINNKLLEKRGIEPLLRLIHSLGGWPVLDPNWNDQDFDWLNLTAQLRRYNNDILIVEWVGPDIKNSDENIIQFDQTNLGLPTREYFLQDINVKYLQAYQRFMSEIMHKLGATKVTALKTAAELIDFETQLASITAPSEKRLNVTQLYKRMTLNELHTLVPQIDWIRYLYILQDRNVTTNEQIVIYAVDYMKDLVNLLSETDSRTIANYLMWRFVRHRINNVDDRFDDTKQTFYHTLFGREEPPSRWKVCISQVNTNMGMALGAMFVRKYFDENSKQDTLKMTHELQQAFRDILKTTDWLDSQTKYLAELKVNAMSLKIGYPDFILNPRELNEKYAGIEIDPEKYFENTINVLLHTAKTEQKKLKEAVNKTTWQTAPAIVNAYYSRNKNQIMFPAGILQPPFYHRHFPRCLNFGGIGVVIGHELTHGFDDKGRLFDKNGSIHKWWSDSAIRGFDERARCIIAQYGNYTVGEVGIALNGESTQGENIADNGGIRQAFRAYKTWLAQNPTVYDDERLPGLNMTGTQLFFLNFGQVWCGAMRPEAVRNKLNTAIHSPGKFRVIGTLSNSEDFAKEFRCALGTPMNPIHKCSVW